MIEQAIRARVRPADELGRQRALIDYLYAMVVTPPFEIERFHAIFLDDKRSFLADAPLGQGTGASLSLRMRDLFSEALAVGASAILIAHNHPSGDCRPSRFDSEATQRLKHIASALDIELLDHLIFTTDAVYSMRAGGIL